jgi:integrase
MRIGEAVALVRDDVDLVTGVVTVRDAKFGRSRVVPVHATTTAALRSYATRRDESSPRSHAFFVPYMTGALSTDSVRKAFKKITAQIGLRTESVRPRVHDLRH